MAPPFDERANREKSRRNVKRSQANVAPPGRPSRTVAGVDVGGKKKGFHAVAVRNGTWVGRIRSCEAAQIVAWCRDIDACVVAVDAPCRWSLTGRARAAERALMAQRIWCFATPTLGVAQAHPKKYYQWMLAGAELFKLLETTHPLFDGKQRGGRTCFETFPHAVACAVAGKVVAAKPKGTSRRQALCQEGYDVSKLT